MVVVVEGKQQKCGGGGGGGVVDGKQQKCGRGGGGGTQQESDGGGGKLLNFIASKTISMRIMLAFSQSTFCYMVLYRGNVKQSEIWVQDQYRGIWCCGCHVILLR